MDEYNPGNEKRILDLKNEIRRIKGQGPILKQKLILEKTNLDGVKMGTKNNGTKYSVRDNRNRIFTPDEWKKFYDTLKLRQQFTANFLINTGARINEAYHIRIVDCDTINKRLTFIQTKVKARLGERHPIPREIKISTEFSKYLRRYINNLPQEVKNNNTNRIGILSQPAFDIAMKKACQKSGIKDYYLFSAHQVRKTAENWIWSLGVKESVFTKTFGHDIDTATEHYLKNDTYRFSEKDTMHEIIGDWAERLKGEKD